MWGAVFAPHPPAEHIEIVCSDQAEHRRRVESRIADIVGHQLPTWQQVCTREYESWPASIVIDTAGQHIKASVSALRERLEGYEQTLRATGDAEQLLDFARS